MISADWYFDFVSPYSYFSLLQLDTLADQVKFSYHPVLFAALLNHWGQKGPGEITPKRRWTYRWCTWWAQQNSIPFEMPAVHPFNPLSYLRLAHAAGCTASAIHTIFGALWTSGPDPRDPSLVNDLADKLGVNIAYLEDKAVKTALKECTDRAIKHGVFGVPSFYIKGQLFWGADAMSFIQAYLANPMLFDRPDMQRVSNLPIGAERKTGV